jgi:hypothetical protein
VRDNSSGRCFTPGFVAAGGRWFLSWWWVDCGRGRHVARVTAGADLGVVDPLAVIAKHAHTHAATHRADLRHTGVQRWVDQRGRIRLAGFGYRVPIVLAGEPVEDLWALVLR